jgi:hypothetical protein
MQKHHKTNEEDWNDDEAATERFINRLDLQRKLLINFIDPATKKGPKNKEGDSETPSVNKKKNKSNRTS